MYAMPMKRWNQKGTIHAKRRMGELRDRKLQIEKGELITKWMVKTGRPGREWWEEAQKSGLTTGTSHEHNLAVIDWLRKATA